MTIDEKLSIARGIIAPLLRKIRAGKVILFDTSTKFYPYKTNRSNNKNLKSNIFYDNLIYVR